MIYKTPLYFLLAGCLILTSCLPATTSNETSSALSIFSTLNSDRPTSNELQATSTHPAEVTPSFAATNLPTLVPSPTLSLPEGLGTCFKAGDPTESYGCVVTTFAGGGKNEVGDGGPAANAELFYPTDVLVTDDGYLIIVDSSQNRIRRVDPNGTIETYIGTGPYWNVNIDGRPANETGLKSPSGLAIGPDGLLYFVDAKLYNVRRLDLDGTVQTIAGEDGIHNVYRQEPFGDGGIATRAWIDQPTEITFDSEGNLYIADTNNDRIRRVDPSGIITTLPLPDLYKPQAIVVDSQGRLFIGHQGPMKVYDTKTGEVTFINNEELWGPTSLAISETGRIYFASASRNQVGSFDNPSKLPANVSVTWIAGTGSAGYSGDDGPAEKAELNYPFGVFPDKEGNLYIADSWNNVVQMVDTDGIIHTVVGNGSTNLLSAVSIPYNQTNIYLTGGMAFDNFGNLFVTGFNFSIIRKIDKNGYVSLVAGDGISRPGDDDVHPLQTSIESITPVFDAFGNLFFVGQGSNTSIIRRISPGKDGEINGSEDERVSTVAGDFVRHHSYGDTLYNVPGLQAVFADIKSIDFDSSGNLFVADWWGNHILMITPGVDGMITGEPDEFVSIVAGTGTARVTGNGGPAIQAGVNRPSVLQVDSEDNIYIREEHQQGFVVIRKINRETGTIETFRTFNQVKWFAFDPEDNLYYSDETQLFRIDNVTNQRTLIAGNGTGGASGAPGGYSGDGGDSRDAAFQFINFFTIDSDGNLYIDDSGNFRIRKISVVLLSE